MAKNSKKIKYRKLKATLIIRAVLIAFILGIVGAFFIEKSMVPSIKRNIVFAMFFLVVFIFTYYLSITSMTKYLDDVVDGIDNVLEKKYESIVLIDELEPLEKKLNELKVALDKQEMDLKNAESKKNDLILYLAHDLKTPLTSIIAYLNIIETHPELTEEKRKKYIHVAYEKALRMHSLTQEFFEITRFHLQGIELTKEEFDLELMLEQIVDELYGILRTKDMKCVLNVKGDLMVHADPDKMARVFDNLLRNAIAYSFVKTAITIESYEIGDQVEIVFRNHGHTISEEALRNLFDKFYRADNSRNSSTGGAGLGLAIAKAIVEAHGGTIEAYSENDIVEFVVNLPKDKICDLKGEKNV